MDEITIFKKYIESEVEETACESCGKLKTELEIKRNAGICDYCAIHGELTK